MTVTIWHNPKCATSRNVLAMIRAAGVEPQVVEYLKTPPGPAELKKIVKATGGSARALLRRKGTPYDELGLDDPKWTDDELIGLMAAQPILIERPVVITDKGTALARPKEKVLELL